MNASVFQLLGESLPSDALVSRFYLEERLSMPFLCEVEFSVLAPTFEPDALLNESLALQIVDASGDTRFVHGQVSELEMIRVVQRRVHFRIVLRPTYWSFSQRSDCRIFSKTTVPDLVKQLLDEANLTSSSEWHLTASYPTREFTVQYRESTLNFIQRLLEDEGISYYFEHSNDGHKLHFIDALSPQNQGDPIFLGLGPRLDGTGSPLVAFSRRKSLRVSEMVVRDFNVQNPEVFPTSQVPIDSKYPREKFEYGVVPGDAESAEHYATARLKAVRHDADVARGVARMCTLWPATLIEIDQVEELQLTGQYFLIETISSGIQETQDGAGQGAADGPEPIRNCQVRFKAVPIDSVYCPPRRARRPKISGVQTALVVGDSEGPQSIDVDSLGRIEVHFHWDRLQPAARGSSCRIRVSQLPLGGSMILPRVGWEVLVAFEEGNPDRPVVLGRAYNAENMPPMSLPADKASGSLSSSSSPGGAGSNEISIGDSGGNQGFSIKAQKDLNAATGFDQTEEVGVDDEHQVNANMTQSVAVDQTISVGANQEETFGANFNLKVTGNQTKSVGGNEMANSTANFLEKVTSTRSVTIGGNYMALSNGERTNISGNMSRTVGAAEIVLTTSSMSDNIAGNLSSTVGAVRVHLVNGSHSQAVAGAKNETIAGGALHKTSGDLSIAAEGALAQLVGALVKRKVTGDLTIKAPLVTIVGAKGKFQGGSGIMDLAGGPIKLKGSKIVVKAATVKITAGSLKLG